MADSKDNLGTGAVLSVVFLVRPGKAPPLSSLALRPRTPSGPESTAGRSPAESRAEVAFGAGLSSFWVWLFSAPGPREELPPAPTHGPESWTERGAKDSAPPADPIPLLLVKSPLPALQLPARSLSFSVESWTL